MALEKGWRYPITMIVGGTAVVTGGMTVIVVMIIVGGTAVVVGGGAVVGVTIIVGGTAVTVGGGTVVDVMPLKVLEIMGAEMIEGGGEMVRFEGETSAFDAMKFRTWPPAQLTVSVPEPKATL